MLKLGDNDRIAEAALYAVKKGMNIEQIEMLVLRMDGLLDPLPDMPGVKKRAEERRGAVGGSKCARGADGPGADARGAGADSGPQGQGQDCD